MKNRKKRNSEFFVGSGEQLLMLIITLWQYGLCSFQVGGTKLERFLPKNQHTQRKLLNFQFWINSKLSKSAKI